MGRISDTDLSPLASKSNLVSQAGVNSTSPTGAVAGKPIRMSAGGIPEGRRAADRHQSRFNHGDARRRRASSSTSHSESPQHRRRVSFPVTGSPERMQQGHPSTGEQDDQRSASQSESLDVLGQNAEMVEYIDTSGSDARLSRSTSVDAAAVA
eukprot:scaffold402286_cov50-Prasinocladus_malaysianus.AAC.1